MAEPKERSLDDFFAKRDKKKKKDKSSASGSRAAATATARPPDSSSASVSGAGKGVKKEKSAKNDSQDTQQERDDDEWKDFEQKEIDYTGLRIQSLQMSNEKDDEENEKKEEQGGEWDEDGGNFQDKTSGPWNKTASAPAPVSLVTEPPEPVQSGVYRPPGARASAATRKPVGPPEIYSDTQFPSLQSTAKHIESKRDKEMEKTFEIVKHKNRAREEGAAAAKNQALRLQLDNQYAVLENNKT
ncbi:LOW QUALITY PROTEIN: protein CDV3 homolog [Bombina bombina]|uniref:LOW QUALITY PROTEIN: protein CDV3 homolog n=1 Tax=Bombina bombina TaxID=8345 RepID=UPI00235A9FEB|nr:LOW QUALITY PROTEIN: protein CDV3 homolog [Bombina bombina]